MLHRISTLFLKPNLSPLSISSLRYQFGKKKKNQQQKDQYQKNLKTTKQIPISPEQLSSATVRDIEQQDGDKSTAIQQKYYKRSAELYDRYLQTQQRPQLTTDNYQINFALVLRRLPIHIPYDEKNFNYYKQRLNIVKQTPYYNQVPSIVQSESTYFYMDQDKMNPQNYITHRNGTQLYAENSKFWRLTPTNINDPRSIQNRSTSSVFLIVKTKEGKWEFPSRPIIQKENFDEWRKNFIKELTGVPDYDMFWSTGKPVYVDRVDVDGLPRGQGIKTFYFDGVHISGITERGHESSFEDHLWVPKFELGKYFEREYFQKTVRLAVTNL